MFISRAIQSRAAGALPTTRSYWLIGIKIFSGGTRPISDRAPTTFKIILWRLNNGELDNVHPKVIVLLAGTNNIGNKVIAGTEDDKIADVTRGIQAALKIMREKAPEATIVLTGIFPRNDNIAVFPIINKVNENLAKLADGKKFDT